MTRGNTTRALRALQSSRLAAAEAGQIVGSSVSSTSEQLLSTRQFIAGLRTLAGEFYT